MKTSHQEVKVLAVVPCHPKESCAEAVESVRCQTVPVTEVLVLSEVSSIKPFPKRMSSILNNALENIKLENYDYLLRVDSDTVLPQNFLEENLKSDAKVMGWGYAQIIHIPTFLKLMHGRFFSEQDDTYIRLMFEMHGQKTCNLTVEPLSSRPFGECHGSGYFIERGQLMYKLGYEPAHIFSKALLNRQSMFMLYGYLKAWIQRLSKFDVSPFVAWTQLRALKHLHSLLRKAKPYLLQKNLG